jgi:hypothetical protein
LFKGLYRGLCLRVYAEVFVVSWVMPGNPLYKTHIHPYYVGGAINDINKYEWYHYNKISRNEWDIDY